jgi:phosphatidylinositol alpha-1,6-mannosyltransferase
MSRRPDIIVVSEVFPPAIGGSGVLLSNIYSRIDRVSDVFTTAENARGYAERNDALPAPGLRVSAAPLHRDDWGFLSVSALRRHGAMSGLLYRRGRHGRAIVHCGRAQPEGIPALLASRLPGGPRFVFWAHGEEITTSRTSREFHAAMKLVYRGASAAIANSHNTARLLVEEGFTASRIRVVHPGVDCGRFAVERSMERRRRFAADDEILLLSVGRLQRRKSHDLVLKALAQLTPALPRLRYVIAGDGEERARLAQLTRDLSLTGRVTLLGAVDDADLPGLFAASDVFVLPTRVDEHDFEGFGIVFLEAAAAGLPSIGGRNGGVTEAIVEGETGLLVSGTSVEELADAIAALVGSTEMRRRMGEAGRRRAREQFTWEQAAAQVAALHDELSRTPAALVKPAAAI